MPEKEPKDMENEELVNELIRIAKEAGRRTMPGSAPLVNTSGDSGLRLIALREETIKRLG